QASVTSAEITGRKPFLKEMSKAQSLPGIPELEKLWFELQREMTATGKVAAFKSEVVQPNGESASKTVTRVGAFNLMAEGDYLEYQGSTGQVLTLAQQPSGRWTGLLDDFEEAGSGFATVGIDPSRGAILGMLVQTPSLMDRVNQGGVVGYIILALLLVGLIIVGERFFVLQKMEGEMKTQLASDTADENNPLGQIQAAYHKYKDAGLETLELKLDEAIIKATPKIKRGITTIKILSGVAPLLGLLGTVTGMILTFQTITLFGTGDPKLMAGGISQALMTTVLGLVCAIPLILLHNFISSKSQRMVQILEEESVGLLASKEEGALS
ncbi:MAG: MotA/TolQ/ExbB proton channel family protein, partial [Pseudomonadota bacterium]